MKHKDLDYFKDLLTRWLDDLLSQAESTVIGLRDVGDRLPDPLDRAVLDINRSYTLRMRDRESILIKKIRASLEDIDEGHYGICEECRCDISIARLKARPVAKRCIECKTRQEKIEKSIGAS
jgi:DnaK suppressor protein